MAKSMRYLDSPEVERLLKNSQKMFRHKIALVRSMESGTLQAVPIINDDPDLTSDKYVLEVTSKSVGARTPDYVRTMSVEDFADIYGLVGWAQSDLHDIEPGESL